SNEFSGPENVALAHPIGHARSNQAGQTAERDPSTLVPRSRNLSPAPCQVSALSVAISVCIFASISPHVVSHNSTLRQRRRVILKSSAWPPDSNITFWH